MDTPNPKMPVLPPWQLSNSVGEVLAVILLVAIFALVIYLLSRYSKARQLRKWDGTGKKVRLVNSNPQNRVPQDENAPLLKIGDTVTLSTENHSGLFSMRIINVDGNTFTVALPAENFLPQICPAGAVMKLGVDIDHTPYTTDVTVDRYTIHGFTALTLVPAEPVTLRNLKKHGSSPQRIDTQFAYIPNKLIDGDYVSFAALHGRITPEITGSITKLQFGAATISTPKALPFSQDDILVCRFVLPDNSAEITIWGVINAVEKADGGNGQQTLQVHFLTADEALNRYLTTHGDTEEPLHLDDTVIP